MLQDDKRKMKKVYYDRSSAFSFCTIYRVERRVHAHDDDEKYFIEERVHPSSEFVL